MSYDPTAKRAELLPVWRDELKQAEHHLTLARQIKADGNDAHSVGYWEAEVFRHTERVASPGTRAGVLVQEVPEGSYRHHPCRLRASPLQSVTS